ncbi:parathyroid hormone 2 receptor-like isoform X2 [Artemia franciscana]|uniref:parathyroid hormone 2 receptor-like isoform X2 n=1 Tax=Artemia franciscana TaxID=6661 RepID=UPI0032DB697B
MSAVSFVIDVDPVIIETVQQDCQATLESEILLEDVVYCPGIFDGWACWNSTPAGVVAYQRCPFYVTGFTPRKRARRECLPDGTWFRHPESNFTWSNYTTCLDTESFEVWQKVNGVYVIGYSVSLAASIVALIIYCTFRSLRCTRVEIHKNLFTAFAITNLMFLIWHSSIVPDADLLLENPIWCQIWHVLTHYFLLSNHLWMLFEGFYLHTILVVTFIDDKQLIRWFYLLGWTAPFPFIIAYALFRITRVGEMGDLIDIKACWLRENNEAKWILVTPIIISLVANLIFLINIVRVLFSKLRNMPGGHYNCKRSNSIFKSESDPLNDMSIGRNSLNKEEFALVHPRLESNEEKSNYGSSSAMSRDSRRTSTVTFSQNVVHLGGSQGTRNELILQSSVDDKNRYLQNKGRRFSRNPKCPCGYKKAVRATLILIPLLGLHYILVPFYEEETLDLDDLPSPDDQNVGPTSWDVAYQMILAVTASFQVIQAFKKKWTQTVRKRKESSVSGRSFSMKVTQRPGNSTRTSWDQAVD